MSSHHVVHVDDEGEPQCDIGNERKVHSLGLSSKIYEGSIQVVPDICPKHYSLESLALRSFSTVEKVFANGDFYCGSWQSGLPDGTGKYLWSDGCMYEGKWERGKKTGRGKISWPSGATYEGDFVGGYIHGLGTYTGVDGTTYKGNWSVNVKHGLGRMRYANGDVYEGSWNQGVQDGPGRYVWEHGSMYMGNWRGGVMSGSGFLKWASEDVFDGEWLDGVEHGHGVYYWVDGSCYLGTWRRGLKDGKGIYVPAESLPSTSKSTTTGVFTDHRHRSELVDELIAAGVLYKGTQSLSFDHGWSALSKSRKSKRRSSSEKFPSKSVGSWDQTLLKNLKLQRRFSLEGSLERLRNSNTDTGLLTTKQPVLEGEEGPFSQVHVVSQPPIVEREYVQGVLISEVVKHPASSIAHRNLKKRQRRQQKEIKRPGETIFKGHRSYDLMLSLQLGIRYMVGKMTPEPKHEVDASDFSPDACVHIDFPRMGSRLTPCHQSADFKWKDYCPRVFRHLRHMFMIDSADYMLSICGNDALREMPSPGKSGSVFFLSQDDRFIIKTLSKAEVKVLLGMLPSYHHHVQEYENTLITKFFGLHRVKPHGGRKVRFVVMGNMFCTDLHIHRRYDLKGSSQGRSTKNVEIDENTTLKDLDLDFVFQLEPSWREALFRQLECDCKFLESQGIMDYSLLLGVHFRAPQYDHVLSPGFCHTPDKPESTLCQAPLEEEAASYTEEEWFHTGGLILVPREPGMEVSTPGLHVRGSPLRAPTGRDEEVDLLLPGTARLQIQLGVNMPARADRRTKAEDINMDGSYLGEVHDVILYLGIIDILQTYDLRKRIEHAYKSLRYDPLSISAVQPKLYGERFQGFIHSIFPPAQI
ncbi:hypothetical protein O6H91_09G097900 [Diphasiastrum complanatum]|uniref:Uncharacterized protein n=1 Tax=Diphasiastrum complanatum TaxID=34168 RepID=A0ACC2CSA9_DIPCM|nr:hypothetical protein O6H91_09G097900 [Diphasiastrum complanatum]